MWTTAGAIFSTTSAMKLNLYLGLVSWWRPALAEIARRVNETQTLPVAPQTPTQEEAPAGAPQGSSMLSSVRRQTHTPHWT